MTLLPELAKWNDGRGISVFDWVAAVGRIDHFIGYANIIRPDFCTYEGRVFIADLFDQNRYHELKKHSAASHDPQIFMNCFDLTSFVLNGQEEPSLAQFRYLAALIAESWQAKAQAEFPAKHFKSIIDDRLLESGVGEILVSIYEPTLA